MCAVEQERQEVRSPKAKCTREHSKQHNGRESRKKTFHLGRREPMSAAGETQRQLEGRGGSGRRAPGVGLHNTLHR